MKSDRHQFFSFFWKYPKLTILFITVIEISLYFDRGAIASALPKIKKNWGLDAIEESLIAVLLTIGIMITSPLWAHYGLRYRINKVIAIGLIIFSIGAFSSAVCGTFSRGKAQKWGYIIFTGFRFIVGCGESAMISLAPTIIDQLSPPQYKTLYMATIMMAAPLGIAMGYGVAGFIVTDRWQNVFFAESVVTFGLAILCIFVPMHDYEHSSSVDPEVNIEVSVEEIKMSTLNNEVNEEVGFMLRKGMLKPKPHSITSSIAPLIKNPVYISIVVLTCIYGAIIGALTFWCPSYLKQRLESIDYTEKEAERYSNIGFGLIVVVGSILGTSLGAIVLDKSGGATGWIGVSRSLIVCGVFVTFALPFGYVSILVESLNLYGMFFIFFFGVFFVLCITAPLQVALVNCVPSELRHFANSYQVFFLHVFGDLPSPFLFGVTVEQIGFKWAMFSLWSFLVPGFLVLVAGSTCSYYNHKKNEKNYETIN